MNNSMNILKRMMAFLLAMLLLTTMMGDDFSSLADSDVDMVTETITDDGAASDVETTEGETADTTTPEPEVTEEVTEPVETEPEVTDPEVTEDVTNPEEINIDDSQNTNETEEIVPEEEVPEEDAEEEECEHDWKAVSNDDGTHTWVCAKCEEQGETEDCEFGEDGICIHCGYEQPVEEEECDHEWEYTSNDDGTHTKRCTKCGVEEVEDCQFNEDWVCELCGYEDMTLEYQEYSKTIHGVKVTVAGEMPRKSKVTIYTKSLTRVNDIVNETIDEGTFEAYEAFDITIYDRHGDKYQPKDDGNSVAVTFEGVSELADTPDEEIVAYRIEDDQETVTEIPTDVAGEDVSFDAEHFSTYVVGTISTNLYASLSGYQNFAYIAQATSANYTRVNGSKFYTRYPSSSGGTITFHAYYYKNLTDSANPLSGTLVDEYQDTIEFDGDEDRTIEFSFPNVGTDANAWVTKNNYYSVVVTMSATCKIGYGAGSTKTYIKNASGTFVRDATYDGIFEENSTNITTASTVSDSYTVESISPTNGTASSAGEYYYAKGETDTFTATLSAEVDRTIEWTSSDTSVATIDSNGKLTAVAPGKTTITGTYNSTSAKATVNIISISIGGTDSVGSTASYSTEYTGSAIKPDIWLYTNSTDYLTTSSDSLTATFDNTNTEVTDAAHVKVSYKVDSKTTYSYDRYFKITAVDITKTDSSSKTAFDDAKYTILDGEITAVTNVNSNSVLSATPSFTNGDFTVTVNGTESTPEGIDTSLTIKGAGNFSGTVDVSTTIEGTDIKDLFTVKITSNDLKDCEYKGADYALTPTTDGWKEVTFYDANGATSKGVITPSTADVTIVNAGTTTEDAKNAGAKTIIFTMKDGQKYKGSISVNFTIQKASLNSVTVNWVTVAGTNEGAKFYHKTDGSAVEPVAGTNFNVTLNGNAIDATEYDVTYPTSNHTDIGQTCTLYLSSKGVNFTSGTSKSETYYIIGKYANDLVIRITDDNGNTYDGAASDYATGYTKYYDGTEDTPTINAYMPGVGNLSKTTDVTIEVFDNKACDKAVSSALGTKYIRVTPVAGGTYKDEATIIGTYTVAERPLTEGIKVTKSSSASSKTFTGGKITLTTATTDDSSGKDLTVKYGTTILTEGTDYEIVYSNNYNVGTASYILKGKGNYIGTLESNSYRFTITQASIVDAASATTDDAIASILNSTLDPIYNGKQKTPNVEVKIGTTTIEQTDSNNSDKANYTVTYGENLSPGKGTVTVTGTNNLTGSVILEFTITSSTAEYSKITILNTSAVKQSESTTSGVVTRVYTCAVDMTYNGSYRTESYNVFGVYADKPLTEGSGYYAEYHNHKNAATYTVGDTTNSPYLEIIGLGSYANNNAIVYFTIKAKDISATTITYTAEQAYNSGTVVEPTFTITDGTTTLTKDTDYTVECFDVDSDGNKTTLTGNAGNKIAVITGAGNYSGTVEKEYTVGTDLSKALVTISSYYYTATTNEETWCTKATNNSSLDSPFEIYWRNSQAPTVSLATTAGTTIDSSNYTVADPVSSLGLTGANLYDARAAESTTDSYNIITYKATGKPTAGYFGTATIYYRINPQSIETTDARMTTAGSSTEYYTGSDITVEPSFIFTYKYEVAGTKKTAAETGYSLELTVGTDVEVDTNIGSKVGDNVTKTATGMGNYTGTQTLGYTIQAGYVDIYRTYNSNKVKIATTSKPTDTSATTPYTYEYDLSDSTDYHADYYYTGSDVLPDISITATNGTTALTKGTDYTITYPTDAVTVGEKEIVINIIGSNYVAQTITIKYEILSNSIEDFVGTVDDVTYTAKTLAISSIKASSLTLKNKAGVELTRGTDYALVTDESELTAINNQFGTSYTSIFVTTSLPSYQTNYVFVKGLGTYSGYCKVPFNVVLDLSANGMSHVYFAEEKPSLANESSIVPVITYKTLGSPNASTYDETLDSSFTYNSNTYNNYTITRGNAGNPGPDTDITVTGQYMCTGSATNVTDADGDTICFLADLSTLANDGTIALSATTFDYTGSSINVLQYLSGISSKAVMGDAGAGSGQVAAGDYVVTYEYKVHAADTSTTPVTTVKEAGFYYLVIKGTSVSDYFLSTSSTGTKLSFYVMYNLSSDSASMIFLNPNDGTKQITSISYTGSEYSFAQNTKITVAGKVIYDYRSSITNYVSITPESGTDIYEYTVKAQIKDAELVTGNIDAKFKITSVGLDTATFTLYNPYDSSKLYSTNPCTYNGGKIEPIVKASITVSGTTKTLTEGTHFKVKYYDNDKAGTAYYQIIGIGSYECDEFAPNNGNNTFTIEKLPLDDSHVKVKVDKTTYGGYYNDPSYPQDGFVQLRPDYAVYYVDSTNQIENKLVEQTDTVDGDYTVTWPQTGMSAGTATLTINAGNSGNITSGTTNTGTITINKLNLSNTSMVDIAQQTAEFTGSEINIADVIKIKSTYTYTSTKSGTSVANQPVYLTQKGAYTSLDNQSLYDYEISVKDGDGNPVTGTTVSKQGTYTITLTGKNSCTGSLETYFTITGRSLEDNFHYYYDYGTTPGFKGSMSSENTDAGYRYKYVGSNGTTAENLTVYVYDVETLNNTNTPTVVIYDKGRTGSTTEGYKLAESEYTVTPYNNTAASTGAWTKTNYTDDNGGLHALPDASLPYIEITGQGDYTGTIKVPFNIGKNLNTVDLEITYTFDSSTELDYNSDYDNPTDSTKARHAYTYNGETQKPTVKVYLKDGTTKKKLVQDTAYTVTYVDDSGETDTSVNAGYKNIVITGMGDYCGTKSQRYSINRKEVTASASPFTTETTMQTTNGELTFTVSGLSRLTSDNAYKYLKSAGLSETEAANYVGYLYAVYDGSSIVPTVTVKDNTLGAKGTTSKPISSDDLIFKPVNDETVSTFASSGDQLNATLSQYKIGFKATSATDFSTSGNYFISASGEEVYKYSVMYIIVPGDISDTTGFTAEFANGLLGNVVPYNAGNEIKPEVVVKRLNSADYLTEGEDYTLTYANNITPRKYDSSTKAWGPNATVTITGINNYSGSQTLDFYIQGKLSDTKPYYYDEDGDFVQGIPTQQYSGTKITQGSPEIYLVLPAQNDQADDYVLTYGMQYEATDGGSTDGFLREGWVEYTGLDYWNGGDAITLDYNIEYDEASITATNFKPSYEYTGYPIKPKFKLSISTATLGTITYSRSGVETTDLTSLGTITASIPYTVGSYEGTVEATYEITSRPIANCEIKLSREYPRYTGRAVEPPFTIYIESTNLQNGETQIYRDLTEYDETTQAGDYSVDYGNYVYGDGKITFTGKSNEITGTVDKEYTIKLQNVANLMVTDTTSNSITVEWVRDIFSSGTELKLYKMNSEGEYTIARETAVEGKTSTYTFDNLSSSTNYKIEAIAYAVNGTTVLESGAESTTAVTGIAVTDITVESNAAGKATVSWRASGNVIIYDIYRANDATSDGKLVAIIPATTYSYTNTKLTSGQEYYYYVKGWAVINGELKQVTESERVPITIK